MRSNAFSSRRASSFAHKGLESKARANATLVTNSSSSSNNNDKEKKKKKKKRRQGEAEAVGDVPPIDFGAFTDAVTAFDEECQNFIHKMSYGAAIQKSEFFGKVVSVSGVSFASPVEESDSPLSFLDDAGSESTKQDKFNLRQEGEGDGDHDLQEGQKEDVDEEEEEGKEGGDASATATKASGMLSKNPKLVQHQEAAHLDINDERRLRALVTAQVNEKDRSLQLGGSVRWSRIDIHAIIHNGFFAEHCLSGIRTVRANAASFRIHDLCCMIQALPRWIKRLELCGNGLGAFQNRKLLEYSIFEVGRHLEEIDLSDNGIDDTLGSQLLLELFGRSVHQSVEHLYVPTMQFLNMSRNKLSRLSCKALSRVLSSDGYPLRYLNLSWNNISPTDMKVLCSAMTLGAQPIDDENIAASEAAAAAAVAAGSQTAEQWAGKEVAARKRAYDAAVAHALERFYDTHAKADKQSDLAKVLKLVSESSEKRDQMVELLTQRYGVRPSLPDHKVHAQMMKALGDHPVQMARRKLEAACGGRHNWMEMFNKLDSDNSGSLDLREFRVGLRKVARIPPNLLDDSDIRHLFRAVDANGNGFIAAAEFARLMQAEIEGDSQHLDMVPGLGMSKRELHQQKKLARLGRRRGKVAEIGYWTSTMEEAVPKSKLEHLDLSWNNLGRKLADERSSATRSLAASGKYRMFDSDEIAAAAAEEDGVVAAQRKGFGGRNVGSKHASRGRSKFNAHKERELKACAPNQARFLTASSDIADFLRKLDPGPFYAWCRAVHGLGTAAFDATESMRTDSVGRLHVLLLLSMRTLQVCLHSALWIFSIAILVARTSF
eukprot:INCI5135.1.p1 GENE.INCI5135.1~~INCI5135.1.p1  ORF type:complete len:830 (+),score=185.97 INCI5135.1:353-2842(+)